MLRCLLRERDINSYARIVEYAQSKNEDWILRIPLKNNNKYILKFNQKLISSRTHAILQVSKSIVSHSSSLTPLFLILIPCF